MSEKAKNKVGIIEIIIPLLYICSPYNIAGISLPVILILVSMVYLWLTGNRIHAYRPLLIFFLFMLLHDLIKMVIVPINIGLWLERIVYMVFLCTIAGKVEYEKLYKTWSFFGFFAVLGLFYQSVQVYLFHTPVKMINLFPFLSTVAENNALAYLRPHSFFLEPASYVVWVIPLICMMLDKAKMIPAIIITISVLLSTSSTGIVMVAVIWGCYAFSLKGDTSKPVRRMFILAGILLIVGIFFSMDIFSSGIDKLMNISIERATNSVRLTLGYKLWWAAPLLYKILGIPYANVESYLRYGGVNLSEYHLNLNISYLGYVNGIGNCMLMYGAIGLFLYLRLFWKVWQDLDKRLKIYFITCVLSILGQSCFWNTIFVMQFAILIGCSPNVKDNAIKFVFGNKNVRV